MMECALVMEGGLMIVVSEVVGRVGKVGARGGYIYWWSIHVSSNFI